MYGLIVGTAVRALAKPIAGAVAKRLPEFALGRMGGEGAAKKIIGSGINQYGMGMQAQDAFGSKPKQESGEFIV